MPEKNVNEIFIDNLKKLLEEKHVTAQEFAKAINVSPSTVSMWLTSKSLPRMDLLDKIADYFNIDVADLYLAPSERNDLIKKVRAAMGLPPTTYAVHFDGDEYTEAELEEIRKFAEFVKSKRKEETD